MITSGYFIIHELHGCYGSLLKRHRVTSVKEAKQIVSSVRRARGRVEVFRFIGNQLVEVTI